jgi:hypothetical protein
MLLNIKKLRRGGGTLLGFAILAFPVIKESNFKRNDNTAVDCLTKGK